MSIFTQTQTSSSNKAVIYQSNSQVYKFETKYANRIELSTIDDYKAMAKYDCVASQLKDNYRKKDNFLSSNVIYADIDTNTTIDSFITDYADYSFVIITSKSHQIDKVNADTGEVTPACDRFHVLFPLSFTIDNRELYETYLIKAIKQFNSDPQCKDAARALFASKNAEVYINNGNDITKLLDTVVIDRLHKHTSVTVKYTPAVIDTVEANECIEIENKTHLNNYTSKVLSGELTKLASAPEGSRNGQLYKTTAYLRKLENGGFPVGNYVARIQEATVSNGSFSEDSAEVMSTISSALTITESILYRIKTKEEVKVTKQATKVEMVTDFINDRYDIRYNEVIGLPEYKIKGSDKDWADLQDHIITDMWAELQLKNSTGYDYLYKVLTSNRCMARFDPFKDYFSKYDDLVPTDFNGVDYIAKLADNIKTKDQKTWHKYFRRWFIGSIGQMLGEVTNHSVLILVEPKGGTGKSMFFRRLTPIVNQYVYEGAMNAGDKDSLMILTRNALVSLDEFEATVTNSDYQALKSLVTRPEIVVRNPYDRNFSRLRRRASFVASSNSFQIIREKSGTRRWLCATVDDSTATPINHSFDNDILIKAYEQAYRAYRSGEKFWFDGSDIDDIIVSNNEYTVSDPETELIHTYVEAGTEWHTAMDIHRHVDEVSNHLCKLSMRKLAEVLINMKLPRKHTNRGNMYQCNLSNFIIEEEVQKEYEAVPLFDNLYTV